MSFPAPPRLHVLHVPGADPERDAIVAALVDQGDVCMHEDPQRTGVMPTWLSALRCATEADDPFSWSLIVQDDAQPLAGWQQHVERACLNSPQPLLGLTHFGKYGEKALERGAPYAEGPYLLWGGAIAYHRSIRRGLLDFASRVWEAEGYKHDDVLACAYAKRAGHETALTSRAIFDQPVERSLLGHTTPIRRPSATVSTHSGPGYRSSPRAVRVSRNGGKDDIERLAAL